MKHSARKAKYSVNVTCSNCGVTCRIWILVGEHVRDQHCDTCGCKTLLRSIASLAWRVGG